ncbi:hypothetical protein SBOR_0023 [Sclerotinia borealis F-4128]|uniref:Uncharacterized protein n=1 Tax=Sclerotinia borealis (strain F-4128) TaxID=1432307 RepID=W9CS33_SCLBF|nr:hypothetical protein SBOR_0023 [Sclerotinia borealis F-4128]
MLIRPQNVLALLINMMSIFLLPAAGRLSLQDIRNCNVFLTKISGLSSAAGLHLTFNILLQIFETEKLELEADITSWIITSPALTMHGALTLKKSFSSFNSSIHKFSSSIIPEQDPSGYSWFFDGLNCSRTKADLDQSYEDDEHTAPTAYLSCSLTLRSRYSTNVGVDRNDGIPSCNFNGKKSGVAQILGIFKNNMRIRAAEMLNHQIQGYLIGNSLGSLMKSLLGEVSSQRVELSTPKKLASARLSRAKTSIKVEIEEDGGEEEEKKVEVAKEASARPSRAKTQGPRQVRERLTGDLPEMQEWIVSSKSDHATRQGQRLPSYVFPTAKLVCSTSTVDDYSKSLSSITFLQSMVKYRRAFRAFAENCTWLADKDMWRWFADNKVQ